MQFEFVSYDQLRENGPLDSGEYKVFVLPMSIRSPAMVCKTLSSLIILTERFCPVFRRSSRSKSRASALAVGRPVGSFGAMFSSGGSKVNVPIGRAAGAAG